MSNMQTDDEVEMLFKALKEAAGSFDYSSPVTFEEFSSGIMDFPFILHKFKEDFESMCSEPKREPRDSADEMSQPSPTKAIFEDPETNLLVDVSVLKEVYDLLRLAQKAKIEDRPSAPEPSLTPRTPAASLTKDAAEMYFTLISSALSLIGQKLDNGADKDSNISELYMMTRMISTALTKLSAAYRATTSSYEDRLVEVREELEASHQSFELAKHQAEVLEENYCQAVGALNQLEWEFQKHKSEAEMALAERSKLESKLEKISQAEEKTLTEMHTIQVDISSKEAEIERLRREVRRLNSLRTIHEMKKDEFTQERLDQYKNDLKLRNSMPIKALTVISPKSQTNRPSQRFLFSELRSDSLNERRVRLAEQGLKRRQEELELTWKLREEETERRYRKLMRELEFKNYELLLRVKSLEASKIDLENTLAEQSTPRSSLQIDALPKEIETDRLSAVKKVQVDKATQSENEAMPFLKTTSNETTDTTPKSTEKTRYSCCWLWS